MGEISVSDKKLLWILRTINNVSKKNLKLNVQLEQRLKNNVPNFPENLKNFLKDWKKLVVPPPLKLSLTSVAKLRWPNSDVILKNLTLLTNQQFLHSARSKLTK